MGQKIRRNINSSLSDKFNIIFYNQNKKAIIKAEKFDIPIICVGNIYLGGTGKTPLSIFIAKEFKKIGKNPAIIRKYYKNHYDEHNLIKSHFKNLILDKNRKFAIKEAIKKKYDIAVLDDGFQDNKIHKNLNIVCLMINYWVMD